MKTKLLLILFLVVITFTFQGCKKDNNNSVQINLKGRWDATSGNIEVFENNVSKSKLSQVANNGEFYFIFSDSKVELYEDSQLAEDGTYTYDQATQKLTIKYDPNDTEIFQLANVTSTNFSIVEEDSEVNGTVTTKTKTEIIFKKQ